MFASKDLFFSRPSGYQISRSVRTRSSASAYFNRTFGSPTSSTIWTWSGWVKRSLTSQYGALFTAWSANSYSDYTVIRFDGDQLVFKDWNTVYRQTSQVFLDFSAWYHIVVAIDTTQATAANRVKIYVNGVQVTAFATSTDITQNSDTSVNNTVIHTLGVNYFSSAPQYFIDGYMTDAYLIDGQQLTPSSFGATNATTGQWSPARYTGTYGTNGFHLTFANTASTTTLGYDTSGNSNNWTTNNISLTAGSTYDSMNDVPTLTSATAANYCVWGLANKNVTLSNGNLAGTTTSGMVVGTIGVSSGKWYWECIPTDTTTQQLFGIISVFNTSLPNYVGGSADSYGYYATNGRAYNNSTSSAYGSSYTNNDVIGIALDLNAGTLIFYKNNTSQGTAFTGLSGTFAPAAGDGATNAWVANFGQQPFVYTPPSGYLALNTYNLSAPTIAQGNKYMDASTYTGNGTSQSLTLGFQPDFTWFKARNIGYSSILTNSVTGGSNYLVTSSTAAEAGGQSLVTSWTSTGVNIGSWIAVNESTITYVAWNWKAGGTAVTNTQGTITSQVSVNLSSGFSIVTYTGNSLAGATRGHGLNALPKMILIKGRAGLYEVDNWHVYHASLPITQGLQLNSSAAAVTSSYFWNDTNPTTTVFSTNNGSSNNYSGQTYVAYCWSEVPGYSAFGSYTGNGSADGPFVYTGFRPTFVMIKATSATSDWWITDTTRNPSNIINYGIRANTSQAEVNDVGQNILSNGFKYKNDTGAPNQSGVTYIYAAFASVPFKYSNAF